MYSHIALVQFCHEHCSFEWQENIFDNWSVNGSNLSNNSETTANGIGTSLFMETSEAGNMVKWSHEHNWDDECHLDL